MICFVLVLYTLLLSSKEVIGAFDLGYHDDSDLTNFVTRPEIKAPLFSVTIHDADSITPGYWFVAPYVFIKQDEQARSYYQTCQTGPAIYDGQGNLVWSGACLFKNQNTCDFRVARVNESDQLSAILYRAPGDEKGRGVILNSSFDVTDSIYVPNIIHNMNMHEFKVIDNGKTALYINHRTDYTDVSELAEFGIDSKTGWILDEGFREVEIATGQTKFEWWMHEHIPLSDSSALVSGLLGPFPRGWDAYHINSVDKNTNGDYLISARYTNAIYKVSGKDGSIVWQLGGDHSSFILDTFNFSRQHDARFVNEDDKTTTISFLDNASDGINSTSTYSSALVIQLDTSLTPMVAKVLRRWVRPDQDVSRLRGNVQLLANGNAFVGWSENSYMSEYTAEGKLLMDAKFTSRRFVTYRSYKFNFTGAPSESPTLKVSTYGTTPLASTTVCYVSWNGATEVAAWEFHRSRNATKQPSLIGTTSRKGFETMFQFTGFEESVYALAISATGEVLGESAIETTVTPQDWQSSYSTAKTSETVLMEEIVEKRLLLRSREAEYLIKPLKDWYWYKTVSAAVFFTTVVLLLVSRLISFFRLHLTSRWGRFAVMSDIEGLKRG